ELQQQLADVEAQLADSALYEAARKDDLRTLLASQTQLKQRESELEESWLEALEVLEQLQAGLAEDS
ncbi:TPA: ABC transporter ATP-binding protein, partial [Klebsiella pneumoniae]